MSASLLVRRMTATDLGFADSLRAAVGWNQTLPDWQRLLALEPSGCFIAEWEGKPAGTATTTRYGSDLAWIGMVLVHPDCRRHGIGRALLEYSIAFLKGRGARCIKLDATPLGKKLYDQLGFRDEWTFTRWEAPGRISEIKNTAGSLNPDATHDCHSERGEESLPAARQAGLRGSRSGLVSGTEGGMGAGALRPLREADWPDLLELDKEAFGVSRRPLLEALAQQSPRAVVLQSAAGKACGFGMFRDGARADYLGPVVAATVEGGLRLARGLLSDEGNRPVFWDLPDAQTAAGDLARQLGFVPQRGLIRMYLGENHCPGQPPMQFAVADPATG